MSARKNKNENVQKRILQHQSQTQNHFVFPKPGTSLLLSDNSEFPSLTESLGSSSNYIPSPGGSLKYSDKLKSTSSSSRYQTSVTSTMHLKSDTYQHDNASRLHRSTSNKNSLSGDLKQDIPKRVSNYPISRSLSLNNKKRNLEKTEITKQKPILNSKLNAQNISIKSTTCNSSDANTSAQTSKQSNNAVNCKNNQSKGEKSSTQDSTKAKKKKNRKSKVKRQVALQSGKITFLTPEVHSKILNQASTINGQNSTKNTVIGNFNDKEEYPELGKVSLPMFQKENFLKMNTTSGDQVETPSKSIDSSVENNLISENIIKEPSEAVDSKTTMVEKKDKIEKVHSHNPITVSFFDMLCEKSSNKKKEIKELQGKTEIPNVIGQSKLKIKKNAAHPHNLLDSSSPAVKRGKEREKPKPKKPSQLKKIILLDRKARKEHLLQMKNNCEEDNITNENILMSEPHEEISEQETVEKEDMLEINFEEDLSVFCEEETLLELTESSDICVQDEVISQLEHLNISKHTDSYNIVSDLSFSSDEVAQNSVLNEKSNSSVNEKPRTEMESNSMVPCINNEIETDAEIHLNIPQFSGSLLSHLTKNILLDVSDKERAVKILLHTRNFRGYCNHLISKDIDDITFSLLDDLARFQDRLHQKDPIKARMKRRLVYGVKEVKKHIKLRKVKCIIIAVDIENVETQGGLNDILNEIKISAVDHRIPCVFALSRKVLGKVCRKPVPVSCVGVFSYEGSEANFKKMVELQSQGKTDYTEIFNKLLTKINDEDVSVLIKAKNEAPETLRDVRTNILSNFFLPPYSMKSEDIDLKSNEDI